MKKDNLAIIIAIKNKKNPMNSNMAPMDDMNDSSSDDSDSGFAGHEMHNVIALDPKAYPDAKDGDEVETTVKGQLVEHDGQKFLVAHSTDGLPVQDMDEEDMEDGGDDEEAEGEGDEGSEQDEGSSDQSGVSDARKQLKDVISKGYGKNMFT